MLHSISFTKYNSTQSVLHYDDIKHFIISDEKRTVLENLWNDSDDNSRNELCEIIEKKGNVFNSAMGLQDYQVRIKLLPSNVMNIITKPFLFLFDNVVLGSMLTLCLVYCVYELFLATHLFLADTFSFDLSWLILGGMFIFHEVGHASACKHYGAPIYDVGIGVAAFRPVLYANVTGAWYLNLKERLVVNIGGVYFQLILTAVTTLIAVYSENTSLFYLSKTMLVSVVFQFFPFYRTDGYWIISDLMGEPNLYKKAIKITSAKIRNWKATVLTKKECSIFAYFVIFECVILVSLLIFIVRSYSVIKSLPSRGLDFFQHMFAGDFHSFQSVSFADVWDVLILLFIIRFILFSINNRKRSAKGATGRLQ